MVTWVAAVTNAATAGTTTIAHDQAAPCTAIINPASHAGIGGRSACGASIVADPLRRLDGPREAGREAGGASREAGDAWRPAGGPKRGTMGAGLDSSAVERDVSAAGRSAGPTLEPSERRVVVGRWVRVGEGETGRDVWARWILGAFGRCAIATMVPLLRALGAQAWPVPR
ncbi:hypothetical protein GCM10010407_14760 [Rarobacter incanus]